MNCMLLTKDYNHVEVNLLPRQSIYETKDTQYSLWSSINVYFCGLIKRTRYVFLDHMKGW